MPALPLLFNIYIKDFATRGRGSGVGVPGLEALPGALQHLLGLYFADNIALTEESEGNLRTSLAGALDWADLWEMAFGAPKLGIMPVNASHREEDFTLQGQPVARVKSYVYLGVRFEEDLGSNGMLTTLIQERAAIGKCLLQCYSRYTLCNQAIHIILDPGEHSQDAYCPFNNIWV